MGKVYLDKKSGNEIEVFDVLKVNLAEGFFFDEHFNKYTFSECFLDPDLVQISKHCVVVIEEGFTFVLNKHTYLGKLEPYLESGDLVEIKE